MIKRKLQTVALVALSVLLWSQCAEQHGGEATESEQSDVKGSDFTPTDTTWKTLSVREKIGQTMMVVSSYYDHKRIGGGSIDSFLVKYPIGGFFMATWYFQAWAPKDEGKTYDYYLRQSMDEYSNASKYPLFYSEDFERGVGLTHEGYTHMPAEMSLGAANDPQLAYDYGKSISLESKAWGINWLLHPVSDLNMNPLHPLVIERSISDDANRAIPLLKKQVQGIHDQNIIATVKHFPGDGATVRDQHMITGANNLSLEEWHKTYGKVFQGLIDDGAPSIMIGHLRFPAYQRDTINGVIPPASLSKDIIQKLLKGEMKFGGVVMSDALNMGGSAGYYPNELETMVAAFEAGTDMMLWPSVEYMDTVEARINRGEIPMSRLDDAVERIWGVRERYGLLTKQNDVVRPLEDADKKFVEKTAQAVADKAITLVRNSDNVLPLTPEKDSSLLLVNISFNDKTKEFQTIKKLLEEKGFKVELRYGLSFFEWGWRIPYFERYSKVIVCFENKYFDPLGTSYLKNYEAHSMWTVNMMPQKNVIGISFSNPYYVSFYMDRCPTLINAYSSDPASQRAVAEIITGKQEFQGSTPVQLVHDVLK